MNALIEPVVFEDVWNGLYGESWKGVISDDAFAHPAKFSRALIRSIYDHVIDAGWANKGDSVVDPFGGVALGGFDAMRHGLNWFGSEIETKFVGLGNQNIALWNERFSRMPNWGTARLIQGDSRKLVEVLTAAGLCVSSPPFCQSLASGKLSDLQLQEMASRGHKPSASGQSADYGNTNGQLGAMKEGDLNLAISSPPYIGALGNAKNYADPEKAKTESEREFLQHFSPTYTDLRYGQTEGQLGAMPEGQLCVSSPPFPQPYTGGGGINIHGYKGAGMSQNEDPNIGKRHYQSKGGDRTEGNLETLDANGFECAVSSPPYEGIRQDGAGIAREGAGGFGAYTEEAVDAWHTQRDQNNLGNLKTGETFWSASRLILDQLHQVIVPGGHAVFVVKAFVRDKKIVDFPAQWAQLCEAVGFRLLHHHRASLVEYSGTQGGFDEDKEIRVERKSFFRRLAESKGSPRIDHESVLCVER